MTKGRYGRLVGLVDKEVDEEVDEELVRLTSHSVGGQLVGPGHVTRVSRVDGLLCSALQYDPRSTTVGMIHSDHHNTVCSPSAMQNGDKLIMKAILKSMPLCVQCPVFRLRLRSADIPYTLREAPTYSDINLPRVCSQTPHPSTL